MRKILLLIVLFGVTITGVRAQVGIGTQDPNPAAQLDITSDPTNPGARGLLIPRVTLTGTTMLLTGIAEAEMPNSILVFNKKSFVEAGKTYSVGYYYWATNSGDIKGAGKWVPILSGEAQVVNNFFNTVNTTSSTVNYNSTSNTLSVNVGNGLKNLTNASGKYIGLGGDLDQATTIVTDASKTLAITGLQSGTTTNTLVVTDANGVLRKVKGVSVSQIVAEASNAGKILSVDSSGLVTWTTIGAGATGGASSSSSSTIVYNSVSNTFDVKVGNGLEEITDASGKYVGLGGTLSKSTIITTDASKTLAIKGLQDGASNDKVVVVDPVSGVLKTVSGVTISQIDAGAGNAGKILTVNSSGLVTWTTIGAGAPGASSSSSSTIVYNTVSNTFDVKVGNGLEEITGTSGKYVGLGGTLSKSTIITTDETNTLAIKGLQAGVGTDKVVVVDPASGVLKTVSGVTISQIDAGTGNSGKILTVDSSGVVTWTSLSGSGGATNTVDFSGIAGEGLTYSTTTGKLNVEGGSGITVEGGKVNWGGDLTKTATIVTDDNKGFVIKPKGGTRTTSNVVIEKLPTGTVSDSFVVVDDKGNLKKVDPKSAAKIDYTDGPQETGRRWKFSTSGTPIDKPVKEITFLVDFGTGGDTKVEVPSGKLGNVTVIGIRLIGADGNPNYINTNATYRHNYDPTTNSTGTKDWIFIGTNQSAFSVKIKNKYFVIVEYFEN